MGLRQNEMKGAADAYRPTAAAPYTTDEGSALQRLLEGMAAMGAERKARDANWVHVEYSARSVLKGAEGAAARLMRDLEDCGGTEAAGLLEQLATVGGADAVRTDGQPVGAGKGGDKDSPVSVNGMDANGPDSWYLAQPELGF